MSLYRSISCNCIESMSPINYNINFTVHNKYESYVSSLCKRAIDTGYYIDERFLWLLAICQFHNMGGANL